MRSCNFITKSCSKFWNSIKKHETFWYFYHASLTLSLKALLLNVNLINFTLCKIVSHHVLKVRLLFWIVFTIVEFFNVEWFFQVLKIKNMSRYSWIFLSKKSWLWSLTVFANDQSTWFYILFISYITKSGYLRSNRKYLNRFVTTQKSQMM